MTDLDLLRAVEMQGHSTAEEMVGWVDKAVESRGWLIFLTHDVRDDASVHGVRPDLLELTIASAIAKGCDVLTVDAALDILEIDQ
jgi:hypothetical protein